MTCIIPRHFGEECYSRGGAQSGGTPVFVGIERVVAAFSKAGTLRKSQLAAFRAAILAVCCMLGPFRDATAQSGHESLHLVPGADRVSPPTGMPPAATAFSGSEVVGYLFSTRETVQSVGYAGNPVDILVGLGRDGTILGAELKSHSEPILIIGVEPEGLSKFISGFVGVNVLAEGDLRPVEQGGRMPPYVAGASVSSAVFADAIVRAAREVLAAHAVPAVQARRQVAFAPFSPATWDQLASDGAIARARISGAQANSRLGIDRYGGDDTVINVALALVTPPRIGQNILGANRYNRLMARLPPDAQAIFIAADGGYSIKGTAYLRTGVFERLQIVQGDTTIPLSRDGYENLESIEAAGAPVFREAGIFIVDSDSFDSVSGWRLDVRIDSPALPPNVAPRVALFSFEYALPPSYVSATDPDSSLPAAPVAEIPTGSLTDAPSLPLGAFWFEAWSSKLPHIVILCVALLALSLILIFQDQLVAEFGRYRRVRIAFLLVTLVWLGWIAGGQLSVVHVLTFVRAFMSGNFQWETFLVDPLVFILWSFVAVAMLFWGRGVFCGWLCPFGALQELLNEIARKFGVRQFTLPFAVHERLWPLKYVIFLALFAVSLNFMTLAIWGAEIEPFKTAIILKFVRPWPFVVFACALLTAGLFVERFYCRYLCPLGAALAIPARLRMFDWLHRRFQCGRSCHSCAERCTVQAIHPNGQINPNECIYCLNCQAMFASPDICPSLRQQIKKELHGHNESHQREEGHA